MDLRIGAKSPVYNVKAVQKPIRKNTSFSSILEEKLLNAPPLSLTYIKEPPKDWEYDENGIAI